MKRKIETEHGIGTIDSIKFSDLGYLQLRIYFEDRKQWITYTSRNGINILMDEFKFKIIE